MDVIRETDAEFHQKKQQSLQEFKAEESSLQAQRDETDTKLAQAKEAHE